MPVVSELYGRARFNFVWHSPVFLNFALDEVYIACRKEAARMAEVCCDAYPSAITEASAASTCDAVERAARRAFPHGVAARPSTMSWFEFLLTATTRQLAGCLDHAPLSAIVPNASQARESCANLRAINGHALRAHLCGDIIMVPSNPAITLCWTDAGACECILYGSRFLLPGSIAIPDAFSPDYFSMFNCAFPLQLENIRDQLAASFHYSFSDPRWNLNGDCLARASFTCAPSGKKYVVAWPPTIDAREAMREIRSARAFVVYNHCAGVLMRYFG